MHRVAAAAALLCIITTGLSSPAGADAIGAGLTAGIPYGLALTLEFPRGYPLIAQVHAGTAIFFSSIGAKAIAYPPRWRFQPFVFIGGAVAHVFGVDLGYPSGTDSYLWRGAGVRYSGNRFLIFMEISYLGGGDPDRAFGETQQGYAGGLLLSF